MAGGTALRGLDRPIVDELFTPGFLELGGRFRVVAPLPIQVCDFLERAQPRGRIAVALQAKRHAERLGVIDLLHSVDLAVAFHTAHPTPDMDGMVEIDIIRDLVDLHPSDWPSRLNALLNQGQSRVVFQDLIVTIHARGRGRDI